MQQEIILRQIGDHELWYAEGQDGSWMLPLLVEWRYDDANGKHYALIQPAISPYEKQLIFLEALFSHHDILNQKRKWIIPRLVCEGILKKAPGITVAMYYKWPEAGCPPIPPRWNISLMGVKWQQSEKAAAADDFVRHVSDRSSLPSSVVAVVWKAICREAPQWMLENKRPIEMGFCQLAALPLRINWKEIVAFKGKKLKLNRIFRGSNNTLHQSLDAVGFQSLVCSPHNIALNRNTKRVTYILEAVPTKQFESIADEYEIKRQSCGSLTYVAHFEETVEKLYHFIVRSMTVYYEKINKAFAKVRVSRTSGRISLLPVGGRQLEKEGFSVANIPTYIVPPDGSFDLTNGKGSPELIQEEADEVQEVPIVPHGTNDVRQCQGEPDVDQQRHNGDAGMLLRHDQEGPASGQPMLADPENPRNPDGLDRT